MIAVSVADRGGQRRVGEDREIVVDDDPQPFGPDRDTGSA